MPRIAAIVALALTLLTGVVIGQLRQMGMEPTPSVAIPAGSQPTFDDAGGFYRAVNSLLEHGDASELRGALAPGFVDHSHLDPDPGDAESFERYLIALRQYSPGLQLDISEITSQNGIVAVRVESAGQPVPEDGRWNLTPPANAEGYELLRVDNGKVAERWASRSLPPLVETMETLDVLASMGQLGEMRLERLTFAPHANLKVTDHRGTLLHVESGSLLLSTVAERSGASLNPAGATQPEEPTESAKELFPGEVHAIAEGGSFYVWNGSDQPATVVWLTIRRVDQQAYSTQSQGEIADAGIQTTLLTGGATIRPQSGPFVLGATRITAQPGTSIAPHDIDEAEVLFVEAGSIGVEPDKGFALVVTANQTIKTHSDPFRLDAGQALSASLTTRLEYRVTGDQPATFWLFTFTEQDA